MVNFVAGGTGEGKTKTLIRMANECAKKTDGHLVYIDDDNRHIFDLDINVRFVETGHWLLTNIGELVGYLLGILSQDNDIKNIFIDGLTKIVREVDNDGLQLLFSRLKAISEQNAVDFVISMNISREALPEGIRELVL